MLCKSGIYSFQYNSFKYVKKVKLITSGSFSWQFFNPVGIGISKLSLIRYSETGVETGSETIFSNSNSRGWKMLGKINTFSTLAFFGSNKMAWNLKKMIW